jgi:uroporphyrinogen decarboxylase
MLLGDEQVLYAFNDHPAMVHDMMETATEFSITMVQKALKEAPVTVVQLWEDMCYRTGSLISPSMFREFMLPRYKRITEVIRGLGTDIIFVDSDGKVDELIPLWLEAGINGVFPMEQAAGNDIHAYRRKYGKNLLMTGGIDKRALARDQAAIDRELELKIPLAAQGGYIPTLDHSIPPDVSYENFLYYWTKKKEMLLS